MSWLDFFSQILGGSPRAAVIAIEDTVLVPIDPDAPARTGGHAGVSNLPARQLCRRAQEGRRW